MGRTISKIVINQGYTDINPVQCGEEVCAPRHSYGPAARTHWLLHFVVSGRGRFTSPRGEFSVGRGEMFVIRPYEITYYEADGEEPWSYIWLGFTSSLRLPPRLTCADVLYAPELATFFRAAADAPDFSLGANGYEAVLCGQIWGILGALSERDSKESEALARYIRPALSIMENEYANGITVEEVAARLHLNRSYFSALFRSTVKKSPRAVLTELRMERAAMLLTRYGYSVTVAAASVGYSDIFVFSRAFKQYYKLSPRDYAKQTFIGS